VNSAMFIRVTERLFYIYFYIEAILSSSGKSASDMEIAIDSDD
jgi:hypothetical protein